MKAERDIKSVKIKREQRLKEENEHVAKHLNWTQLNDAMGTHVRKYTECYPAFYTDECPIGIVQVPMMHVQNLKLAIQNISLEHLFICLDGEY